MIAEALRHMLAAGMPHEAIVAAVADMEASIQVTDPVADKRRAYDRERKRQAKADNSTGIPPESVETADLSPVLDKETSPRPPKEIKPNPRVGIALARKAGGFGPPESVDLSLWNEFCGQRKKPLTQTAYTAILNKLAEAAEAGWPPGDLFTRALEGSWETIFIPREPRNGRTNSMAGTGKPGNRSSGVGLIDAIRESRANREAVPWDAGDTGGMQIVAGVG